MTTPNIEELCLLAQTLEFSDAVRCSIQRAADLLQSQAECLNTLDADYRESLDEVNQRNYELRKENDTLRDQLDAIAATEPVAWFFTDTQSGDQEADTDPDSYTREVATGYKRKQPLFTNPMPAQDVTELVEALEGLMHKDCGEPAFVKARTALSKYKGAK